MGGKETLIKVNQRNPSEYEIYQGITVQLDTKYYLT